MTPENNYFLHQKLWRILWAILLAHLVIWSIAPIFIRHSVNSDIIEALVWGQQFQWGYDKNPWVTGWLAHIGGLFGPSGIGIYFIQQLFIVIGLWSIARLTTALSNPVYGIIAALMWEVSACYTVDIQIYNDNQILQGLLPLSAWLFYQAVHTQRWRYWISASVVLGFATMAKYNAGMLLPLFGLYLLLPQYRYYFRTLKPYCTLLLYCLILLPNFIWLYQHDFITLHYAFMKRGLFLQQTWLEMLQKNLTFLLHIGLSLLPALLALCFALTRSRKYSPTDHSLVKTSKFSLFSLQEKQEIQGLFTNRQTTTDSKRFIFLVALSPWLVLLGMAFIMGFSLHREWGTTFAGLLGAYLLLTFCPKVSYRSLTRFLVLVIFMLFAWPIGYLTFSYQRDTGTYPGPEIARFVTQLWHERYHKPLRYVAGDRYVAGYVGFYSTDKPSVWMEWDNKVSPWIDVKKLKCQGAVFVQDSGHTVQHFFSGTQFPAFVLQQFPELIILPLQDFAWYRNQRKRNNIQLLIGVLPPDPKCSDDS